MLAWELINKIRPVLDQLKKPADNFQAKVYKAITDKDPPQYLQNRIHQAIAPIKEPPRFKLSDLDTVAAIAASA